MGRLILPPTFRQDQKVAPWWCGFTPGASTWNSGTKTSSPQRGIYLFPNFRGKNDDVEACGSDNARRDVIAALDCVMEHYPVDPERVYLTGIYGEAFMTQDQTQEVAATPEGAYNGLEFGTAARAGAALEAS